MAILQKTGVTGSLSISSSGIKLTTSASLFSVNGYNGRLLNVVDTLSGSLFSVNSIAGLPILEVFSNNRVVAGKYAANDFVISGSRVGIGTSSPSTKTQILDSVSSPALGTLRVKSTGGNSSICIDANSTSDYAYFTLAQANTGKFEMGIVPTTSDFYLNSNVQVGSTNASIYIKKSDGNVGIGTTTVSYKFHVYRGVASTDAIAMHVEDNTSYLRYIPSLGGGSYNGASVAGGSALITTLGREFWIGQHDGAAIRFASDETLYIYNGTGGINLTSATTGNIGIGTTSPSAILNIRASAPTSTGTVTTGTNLLIDSNTNNYLTFRNTADNATYAGLTFLDNNTGGYVVFRNYASNDVIAGSDCMIYGTYQDHIFQNGTSETVNVKPETMRIKQNGSVGIGANSPAAKLHISSSTTTALRIETKVSSGADSEIEFVGPDTHSYAMGIDESDSDKFKISYAASRTPPTLGTNDRFIIQTNGNVGIGTTVAETALSVGDLNLGQVGIGTVTYNGIWLTGGTSSTDFSFLSSPSDTNFYINCPTTKGMYFQVANNNRLIVSQSYVRINNSAAGANNEVFQRWSYVSTDSYYLDLKQTVTAGVVRYNFSMVNNGTTYNDVLILDRGNVGIGTTGAAAGSTLEAKLDVLGTAKISDDTGIGAVNDGTARLYVQGATLTEPFLSVQTCLGNNSTLTATYNVLKGYLAIKIGNNVGTSGALITAGTYYLRLWSNA